MVLNLFNQVVAEVKVSYSHNIAPKNRTKITCSKDIYDLVSPIWEDVEYRETFAILLLNRGNQVLGITTISKGGISGTVVDNKLIFQAALKANTSYIVLMHNHPSGTKSPSEPDLQITRKAKEAAELLQLTILDHIIITSDGYYSLADEGSM